MARFSGGSGGGEGLPGPTGPTGDSAYEVAVDNGFIGTEQEWLDSLGGTGDLIVPVNIKDADGNNFISFERTGTNTARIETPQDDLSLRSARDITLFAGSEGPGNVYIGWGDAVYTPDSLNRVATIGDIQSGTTGDITFDGVKIIGAGTASGDGYNNGTMQLVPDADLYANNQYLIVDPTSPNHIHIRAGGGQDNSQAILFLGGERTHVQIADNNGQVYVVSKRPDTTNTYVNIEGDEPTIFSIAEDLSSIQPYSNFSVDVDGTLYQIDAVSYNSVAGVTQITASPATFVLGNSYTIHELNGENYWTFTNEGYLSGPAMGGLLVSGILNGEGDLYVQSSDNVVIGGGQTGGEYLNDPTDGNNQIATIGDVIMSQGAGGNGEVIRWSPDFTATGLAFTGTDTTYPTYNSHYVKNGRMVSFFIEIDLATVTNFGTGQYKTVLPFAPLAGTMNHFPAWVNVDPTLNPDIAGHVILQADHLGNTSVIDIHYIKQAGGANSPLMEAIFAQDSPAELTAASKIYINGTYITAE